jgi:hypothetical protein
MTHAIIIGDEKHGEQIYESALACVKYRYEQGVYDYDVDEKNRKRHAEDILNNRAYRDPEFTETLAWSLLLAYGTVEYEGVTRVTVITGQE